MQSLRFENMYTAAHHTPQIRNARLELSRGRTETCFHLQEPIAFIMLHVMLDCACAKVIHKLLVAASDLHILFFANRSMYKVMLQFVSNGGRPATCSHTACAHQTKGPPYSPRQAATAGIHGTLAVSDSTNRYCFRCCYCCSQCHRLGRLHRILFGILYASASRHWSTECRRLALIRRLRPHHFRMLVDFQT